MGSRGLDELVLHGEARGSSAGGDARLAVNRGQVRVDGAGTDDELFGNLSGGHRRLGVLEG